MQAILEQIITKIRRNRISSTQVADCLSKSGVLPGVRPLNPGHHRVGPVFWTYAFKESNWEFHEQIRETPEGAIVLTEAFDCGDRAVYGELVAKYLILYRQASALVLCGFLRDVANLLKERWPIWMVGTTPIGCFNQKNTELLDPLLVAAHRQLYQGSIAVCDDTGVVVIPPQHINQDFLNKLDWIEEQEDIWFDCIDRLKWDTYETVCLKKYREFAPGAPESRPRPDPERQQEPRS